MCMMHIWDLKGWSLFVVMAMEVIYITQALVKDMVFAVFILARWNVGGKARGYVLC